MLCQGKNFLFNLVEFVMMGTVMVTVLVFIMLIGMAIHDFKT